MNPISNRDELLALYPGCDVATVVKNGLVGLIDFDKPTKTKTPWGEEKTAVPGEHKWIFQKADPKDNYPITNEEFDQDEGGYRFVYTDADGRDWYKKVGSKYTNAGYFVPKGSQPVPVHSQEHEDGEYDLAYPGDFISFGLKKGELWVISDEAFHTVDNESGLQDYEVIGSAPQSDFTS